METIKIRLILSFTRSIRSYVWKFKVKHYSLSFQSCSFKFNWSKLEKILPLHEKPLIKTNWCTSVVRSVVTRILYSTAVILVYYDDWTKWRKFNLGVYSTWLRSRPGTARHGPTRAEIGHTFEKLITFLISSPDELKLCTVVQHALNCTFSPAAKM